MFITFWLLLPLHADTGCILVYYPPSEQSYFIMFAPPTYLCYTTGYHSCFSSTLLSLMPWPRRRGGRVCSTDALFISQVLVLATLLAVCPEIFKRSNRFLVDRNIQAPYTLNQFQRHFSLVAAVYFAVLAPIHHSSRRWLPSTTWSESAPSVSSQFALNVASTIFSELPNIISFQMR